MSASDSSQKTIARRPKGYALGIILTLSSSILWGSAYPIIQLSLRYYDSFTISVYRALLATMVLLLYVVLTKKEIRPRREDLPYLLLASVIGASGFWTLLNSAVLYLESDTTSFLTALYPLIAIVLATIVLHEKMKVFSAIGVLMGIAGTFVIVALGEKASFAGSSPYLGSLIALVSAFSWAGYIVTTRYLVGRTRKSGTQAGPEYVTFNTILFAVPVTILLMLITSGGRDFANSSPAGISYMLYLGVAASGIAFLVFNKGMKIIGVIGASINQLLFPAVSVILSFAILGETVNGFDIVGMAMIVAGIVSAQILSR